jgi:hypothetical protein
VVTKLYWIKRCQTQYSKLDTVVPVLVPGVVPRCTDVCMEIGGVVDPRREE